MVEGCDDDKPATRRDLTLLQQFIDQHNKLADRALTIHASDMERRLAEMNEFRKQLDKERVTYITRSQYDDRHQVLIDRLDRVDGSQQNVLGRLWAMGAIWTILTVVLNIIVGVLSIHSQTPH